MLTRIRTGCAVVFFLVAIAGMFAWGPITRRMTNSVFEKTTTEVLNALPEPERPEAARTCAALWEAFRTHDISNERATAFNELRKFTFTILEDNRITEPEAREFVVRAAKTEALLAGRAPVPDSAARGDTVSSVAPGLPGRP